MFSHVDDKNRPTMVDVTDKAISSRVARAQSFVQLPVEVQPYLSDNELTLKKGPVFQTAIIAGTMAAKKTSELIPFCHQIPLEACKFEITIDSSLLVKIECEVKTTHKTGVEMEALHGAMTAALTVYDMCKALSHQITITDTKLISKTGGKRPFLDRPTYGLVLTGGKSERMGRDKALIEYCGSPHAEYIMKQLEPYCDGVYLSAKKDQWKGSALETLPMIEDSVNGKGPMVGILSAFDRHPDANWIVVACDLVHFNQRIIETLLANFDSNSPATAFANKERGFPEPLCALYTPAAREIFAQALKNDITCPVKVLRQTKVNLLNQTFEINLANVNTHQELLEVQN
jgi:cyclic pyranopterin monophosphate synthase